MSLVDILCILWVSFLTIVAGLIYIRKLILLHYGYPLKGYIMSFFYWIDARQLSEIAKTENSSRLTALFKGINILVPTLSIISCFLMFLSGVISYFSLR